MEHARRHVEMQIRQGQRRNWPERRTRNAERQKKPTWHTEKPAQRKNGSSNQQYKIIIEEATGDSRKTWKIVRWIKNRETPYQPATPYMKRRDGTIANTPSAKAACLAESFFPQAPATDLEDIQTTIYPDPVAFPDIALEEIRKAVLGFPTQSAPGADEIPNQILKIALPLLLPYLLWLFKNCPHLGYYPRHFRESITVSLQKGKPDYHIPKAYRTIALINTLGKTLDSIITTRLSWAAETFELLPRGHLGRRKGTSPELALHMLLESIHALLQMPKLEGSLSRLTKLCPGDTQSLFTMNERKNTRRFYVSYAQEYAG